MKRNDIIVRNTTSADFPGIIDLCGRIYPGAAPWTQQQLASHLAVFPEGQLVAVEAGSNLVVGMAASLIVRWDHYPFDGNWRDFTALGYFTNHDAAHGKTLYGAEVMVRPDLQGFGIGSKLYRARRAVAEKFRLLRIRAGARLRGYSRWAHKLRVDQYVFRVIYGALRDPTLSFQLRKGFTVIGVVSNYLRHDPESLGYAAVIEWLNPTVAANPRIGTALPRNPAALGMAAGQRKEVIGE